MTSLLFMHIDVNNFYAACHTLFEPSIQQKPLVVLSSNDGNAIACSPKARLLGIKRGTPLFAILPWVDAFGIILRSASFSLYADMSRRILETLTQFSSHIEFYSIDEMFVEIPRESAEALSKLASKTRDTIRLFTGLVVSIGLGPSKVLAKPATRLAKKCDSGIVDLASDPFRRKLWVVNVHRSDTRFAMECVILHRSDDFSPTKMGCSKRSHKHILCRENRLFQNEQMEQEEPRSCI